jgi:hypothetical protein
MRVSPDPIDSAAVTDNTQKSVDATPTPAARRLLVDRTLREEGTQGAVLSPHIDGTALREKENWAYAWKMIGERHKG